MTFLGNTYLLRSVAQKTDRSALSGLGQRIRRHNAFIPASAEPTSTTTEPLRQPQPPGLFRTLAPDADRIRVVNAYANAVNRPVRRTGVDLAEVTVLRYKRHRTSVAVYFAEGLLRRCLSCPRASLRLPLLLRCLFCCAAASVTRWPWQDRKLPPRRC